MYKQLASASKGNEVLESGAQWMVVAVETLKDLSNVLQSVPWIGVLAVTTSRILQMMDDVRTNRERLIKIARLATDIVIAISNPFAGRSEEDIDPVQRLSLERDIGDLKQVLDEILRFVQNQRAKGFIWKAFESRRERDILDGFTQDLDRALALFNLQSNISLRVSDALLQKQQDEKPVVGARSSIPPLPQLIKGREAVVTEIVALMTSKDKSNVCILGPGGMGKTTVSLAVLHHADVISKFGPNRYFITCDAASSAETLLGVISTAMGVENDSHTLLVKLQPRKPFEWALLVLDNFESPWDTGHLRPAVEKLLTTLTSCHYLYLPTLSLTSAKEVFSTITDRPQSDATMNDLLRNLDCVPLAVTLMAQVAKVDIDLQDLLTLWDEQKTLMLGQDGSDRHSSLNVSIQLSLDSPRMKNSPHALEMLGVLSLFPDGSQESHISGLCSWMLKADQISSRHTLLGLSLCQLENKRYKVLAPIRAFMLKYHFPSMGSLQEAGRFYIEFVIHLGHGTTPDGQSQLVNEFGNFIALFSYLLEQNILVNEVIDTFQKLLQFMGSTRMISLKVADECIAKAENMGNDQLHASLLWLKGRLHYFLDQYDLALGIYQKALKECLRLAFAEGEISNLLGIANVHRMRRNHAESMEFLQTAERRCQETKDDYHLVECLGASATSHGSKWNSTLRFSALGRPWNSLSVWDGCDFDQALPKIQDALDLCTDVGPLRLKAGCLWSLGEIYRGQHKFTEARNVVKEAILVSQKISLETTEADCFHTLAIIHWQEGDHAGAIKYFKEAISIFERCDGKRKLAESFQYMGICMEILRQYSEAAESLRTAIRVFQDLGSQSQVDECEQILSHIQVNLNRPGKSR